MEGPVGRRQPVAHERPDPVEQRALAELPTLRHQHLVDGLGGVQHVERTPPQPHLHDVTASPQPLQERHPPPRQPQQMPDHRHPTGRKRNPAPLSCSLPSLLAQVRRNTVATTSPGDTGHSDDHLSRFPSRKSLRGSGLPEIISCRPGSVRPRWRAKNRSMPSVSNPGISPCVPGFACRGFSAGLSASNSAHACLTVLRTRALGTEKAETDPPSSYP